MRKMLLSFKSEVQDLMADSKEKGREEGREMALIETAKNLLDVLSDEVTAEKLSLSLEKVQNFVKKITN